MVTYQTKLLKNSQDFAVLRQIKPSISKQDLDYFLSNKLTIANAPTILIQNHDTSEYLGFISCTLSYSTHKGIGLDITEIFIKDTKLSVIPSDQESRRFIIIKLLEAVKTYAQLHFSEIRAILKLSNEDQKTFESLGYENVSQQHGLVIFELDSEKIRTICQATSRKLPEKFQIIPVNQPAQAADLKVVLQMVKDLIVHESCNYNGYSATSKNPNLEQVQEFIAESESRVWLTDLQLSYDVLHVNSSGDQIRHFLDDLFMQENQFKVWTVKDKSDNNKIAGFISCIVQYSTTSASKKIYIEDYYLAENYRSSGLGFLLMQTVCQFAEKNQVTHINWGCYGFNTGSVAYYKKIGAVDVVESENRCLYACSLDKNRRDNHQRYEKLMGENLK